MAGPPTEAATEVMRPALAHAPRLGTVVVGEGARDEAPMPFDGEPLGADRGMEFDIAVDPLECTTLCAEGLPGSLATIAFAAPGSMASLGVAFCMDKLVGPPALRGVLDLTAAPESNLERAAAALDKPVEQLRVFPLAPRADKLVHLTLEQLAKHTEPDFDRQSQQPLLRSPNQLTQSFVHALGQHGLIVDRLRDRYGLNHGGSSFGLGRSAHHAPTGSGRAGGTAVTSKFYEHRGNPVPPGGQQTTTGVQLGGRSARSNRQRRRRRAAAAAPT